MKRSMLAITVAVVAATVMLAGCTGNAEEPSPVAPATTVSPSPAETDDSAPETLVARAEAALDVFVAPGGSVERTLPATTGFGTQTVLLVTQTGTGDQEGWLEVLLPVRPNGTTGWIRTTAVDVRPVDLEVRIDLTARTLALADSGTVLWTTPTAIGDADHPTPAGVFYVTDKLDTGEPEGAYGPYALGLSARSDVLTQFAGGDGQVGIHGTNVPDSIGQAASHGCLRIDNALVTELAHLLPLGAPVVIS